MEQTLCCSPDLSQLADHTADLVSCPQDMITQPMSAGAGPSAPSISLQHIYDGIFRGMPSGHVARSASQSIGMASLKLALVDVNMLMTVLVVCPCG